MQETGDLTQVRGEDNLQKDGEEGSHDVNLSTN